MTRSITVCLIVCTTLIARADGWGTTFIPTSVASHLEGRTSYSVVAAGENAGPAAQTLMRALEESKRAEVVLPGENLGDVTGLDDQAIVAKTKSLPVQRVAIVRVFGTRAVVTVYGIDGKPVVAFSGAEGTPMEAREAAPSSGVGDSLAATVTQVTRGDGAKKAQEEYEQKYLWFTDVVGVVQNGAVVSGSTLIFRGKFREQLEPDAFLELVGRTDYAEEYRSNRSAAAWGLCGGLSLAAVGIVGAAVAPLIIGEAAADDCRGDDRMACEARNAAEIRPYAITASVALGLAGVGGTIWMIRGGVRNTNAVPATPHEMRRLADDYNRRLRVELGLEEEIATTPEPMIHDPRVGLTPTGGGAMAGLSFRF